MGSTHILEVGAFWEPDVPNHIVVFKKIKKSARLTRESPSTWASPFLFPSEDVPTSGLNEETDEPLEGTLVLAAVLSSRSSGNDTSNAVSLRRVAMGRGVSHFLFLKKKLVRLEGQVQSWCRRAEPSTGLKMIVTIIPIKAKGSRRCLLCIRGPRPCRYDGLKPDL